MKSPVGVPPEAGQEAGQTVAELLRAVERIGVEVAGPAAADVDARGASPRSRSRR